MNVKFILNSGRHTNEWFVCYDTYNEMEYYLCTTDFSVHPMEYQLHEYSDYYNPPKLAKIGLKIEHQPLMEYIEQIEEIPTTSPKRTRKANKKKKQNQNLKQNSKTDNVLLKDIEKKEKQRPENDVMPAPPMEKKKKKHKKKKKKKKEHDPFMPPSVGKSKRKKKVKF